jgi:hypothetical protein
MHYGPPADADLSVGLGSAGAFEVALFESENESENAKCD